jgi:hypothetical protein
MNDGSYEDLGGVVPQEDSTDAWDVGGAIYEACAKCGAKAHERCTVMTASGRKERGMPCIGRIVGGGDAA